MRELRKWIMCILMIIMCLRSCAAHDIFAYTVYEGNISSSYLTYFRDILGKLDFDDDYVVFRSGQYEYILAAGNFVYNNGIFSSDDDVSFYCLSSSNTAYSSYTLYSTYEESDFTLDPGDKVVYSNLGDYPQLEERSDIVENAIFILLFIMFIMFLIHPIFDFVLRKCKSC